MNVIAATLEKGGERVGVFNSGDLAKVTEAARQAKAQGEPVFLIGHSLGAQTALDSAGQLLESGTPPDHLITVDPFVEPDTVVPGDIPATNFHRRSGLPFGMPLSGSNVENEFVRGLGLDGHLKITEQEAVQSRISRIVLGRRK